MMKDNLIHVMQQCIEKEAAELLKIASTVDEAFVSFASILSECKGKIFITGVGKSMIAGEKIASSFASVGIPSMSTDPLALLHGNLGIFTPDDILICISNSGETDILNEVVDSVKKLGVKTLAITGNPFSTLANKTAACIVINTEEAGAFGFLPSSSIVATIAVGDALLLALIELKHLTIENFRRVHPSGTLSRR